MSTEHEANAPAAGENAVVDTTPTNETVSTPPVTESKDVGQQPGAHEHAGAATPASEGETDQPQRDSRAKDRIQELVKRAKEAEARALAAENQLSTYQSEGLKEPHEYATDAEYQRALIREELRESKRQDLVDRQREAAQMAQSERQNIYSARAEEMRNRVPDFEQVAHSPNVPYSNAMVELVQESDLGPEIAYHLGKNPHEADRIARLSPIQAAREIGRLESRFSQKAAPKVSNAPPPIKTIQGTGAIEQKSYEDMSYEEYRKARGF